jgi:hypothetical protein
MLVWLAGDAGAMAIAQALAANMRSSLAELSMKDGDARKLSVLDSTPKPIYLISKRRIPEC